MTVMKSYARVLLTHVPTGIMTMGFADYSLHKARDRAMEQLRSKVAAQASAPYPQPVIYHYDYGAWDPWKTPECPRRDGEEFPYDLRPFRTRV